MEVTPVEETIAQMYSLGRVGALVVIALLCLIAVLLDRRPRRFTTAGAIIRAVLALIGFATLLVISSVSVNWLWGAIAAVAGAGLGYLAGRGSTNSPGGRGSLTISRSVWPMFVVMLSYVLAALMLLYGTTGLFSVAMLVVLLGAMMVVGASTAEVALARGAGPVVTPTAVEDATTA